MKLLLYVYIFFVITISIHAALTPEEKKFNANALDLKKKLIEAKKSFKFKTIIPGKSKIKVSESVFVIKDKNSSASAFYTSLWGVPVGITNTNAIATMQKSIISDSKGNYYKIKSMLALPEQDIIIFEITAPGTLKPLTIAYDLASFPVNSPTLSYGNQQVQGVITKVKGLIKNITKRKIEISNAIVPSSSGGPLICKNKVIGVLTYPAQSIPGKLNLQGTLFEGKNIYLEKYYGPPKISGIRINAINPDQSEIFNPISNAGDIKVIKELRKANNKALDYKIKVMKIILKGKKAQKKQLRSVWALVHMNKNLKKAVAGFYSRLSVDPDKYTCSNKVLKKRFREELSIYRRNALLWDFEEIFSSQAPAFHKKFISIVKKLKRRLQLAPKCKSCKGKGYHMVEINNPAYLKNKMKFAFKTTYLKCEKCHGTGKVIVSRYYYTLKKKQYADKISKPLKISFLGFTPGKAKADSWTETRKMLFMEKVRSDISTTYFYNKNPRFRLANSLALNYVMGKLQEVKIYFPYSKELYQQMKNRLEKKYGKFTWETKDKSTFCQIDKTDYRITIGRIYRISAKSKLTNSLYISCKHKELSKAKCAFSRLRYTASKVKDFKLKINNNNNKTGF